VKTIVAVIVLLALCGDLKAQPGAAVVQIMSRPAASLIGAVRPLLGESGGVSAFHDKLIIRGSPEQIAAAKALIAELDRPARRLIIEVRQASQVDLSSQRFDYGARTDNVELGRVPPGQRAKLGFQRLQTRGRTDALQRVQALDGQPAMIRVGQSVPVYQTYQQVIGNQVVQSFDVRYRDADRGFIALPRIHGKDVTVEIYQQDDRPTRYGRFDTQSASTILRGQIGEWLTLGSVGDSRDDTGNQIGGHVSTRRAEDRRLMLRILPVD
jgi:type II secretory pathway component GspD/PulD (secretin)